MSPEGERIMAEACRQMAEAGDRARAFMAARPVPTPPTMAEVWAGLRFAVVPMSPTVHRLGVVK
jgi:hypothetical protein